MTADLRDKIAANLYFTNEVTGQGDATWPELVATYGDDYETVVKYREMADVILPVIEGVIAEARETAELSWRYQVRELQDQRGRFVDRIHELEAEVGRLRAEEVAARDKGSRKAYQDASLVIASRVNTRPMGSPVSEPLRECSNLDPHRVHIHDHGRAVCGGIS